MPSELSASEVTAEVARLLRSYSFRYKDEDALQRGVEQALEQAGAPFLREFRLDSYNRIDFLVKAIASVGIEVKIDGASTTVARQLRRYLKHEAIEGLVLVTTRRRHRSLSVVGGVKPVEVVWLGFDGL